MFWKQKNAEQGKRRPLTTWVILVRTLYSTKWVRQTTLKGKVLAKT
jgi:hypothetical protein